MSEDKFKGTNCANCKFLKKDSVRDVDSSELNEQGGIDYKDPEDLKKAKAVDLVTLPGDNKILKMGFCDHPKVKLNVTPKTCCALWDNKDAIRAWEELSKSEETIEVPHEVVMRNSIPHNQGHE